MNRIPCTLTWCTASHDRDNERIRHHEAIIDSRQLDNTTLVVLALWGERLDGRRGVDAHVAVIGPDGLHEDLTPAQAGDWSQLLTMTGGDPWLAGALTRGAEILAPYEDHEDDGLPHRVADDAPAKIAETRRAGADRFTWGLVIGVFDVLEAHGYRKGDDQHTGRAIGMLTELADVYEGDDQR